jgi:IS4 transposase
LAQTRWEIELIFKELKSRYGIDPDLMELFDVYQSQALDPNVNRKRLMDEWRT